MIPLPEIFFLCARYKGHPDSVRDVLGLFSLVFQRSYIDFFGKRVHSEQIQETELSQRPDFLSFVVNR